MVMQRKQTSSARRRAALADPEGDIVVQARISRVAHKLLVARAEQDTRSIANYIERLLYAHLGIAEEL